MALERKKFRDIFSEEGDNLCLLSDLKVKDEVFRAGQRFTKKERLGGVDFHVLRYLDLALEKDTNTNIYEIKGFYEEE
jgi:hypothetical protein